MTRQRHPVINETQSRQLQDDFLNQIISKRDDVAPIGKSEHLARIEKLSQQLQAHHMDAIYLHGGTNLLYFTGVKWSPSERMCGAIIDADGRIFYIVPHFEIGTFSEMIQCQGEVHAWHEHESPYRLINDIITQQITRHITTNGNIAIDGNLPFNQFSALNESTPNLVLSNGQPYIDACRLIKSQNEINLLHKAMNMTLDIHKMVREILYPGIGANEVHLFIDKAHRKMGFDNGAYFSIVLFGQDSSFPHGVKNPMPMKENDVVLIDCGGQLHGYHSDITRTYFFGEPTEQQRQMWQMEKSLCQTAFNHAKLGDPCRHIDAAIRAELSKNNLGPDYQLPGVAHRTGHGIGLDIHEPPFLVLNDETRLAKGMCFSVEPMICVPNEFGIRIEDHIYMDDDGPVWFTEPPKSIDDII